MVKRFFATLVAVLFLFSLSACSGESDAEAQNIYPERGNLRALYIENSGSDEVACKGDLQQVYTTSAATVAVNTMTATAKWDKETVSIALSEDKSYRAVAGFVTGKNGGSETFLIPEGTQHFVLNAKTDFNAVAPFDDVVLCIQGGM